MFHVLLNVIAIPLKAGVAIFIYLLYEDCFTPFAITLSDKGQKTQWNVAEGNFYLTLKNEHDKTFGKQYK